VLLFVVFRLADVYPDDIREYQVIMLVGFFQMDESGLHAWLQFGPIDQGIVLLLPVRYAFEVQGVVSAHPELAGYVCASMAGPAIDDNRGVRVDCGQFLL